MEDWVASDALPVEVALSAVRESDIVVVLVAWRYGYVPPGATQSITELEVRAAQEAGLPCLVFMVPEDALWPANLIDSDTARIRAFRESLLQNYVVGFLRNADDAALQVAQALHRWTAEGRTTSPTIPVEPEPTDEALGPEVFVSYAHEDLLIAEGIAARLEHERWSVFWDRRIPVGLTWDDIVERALDSAKCVVVLWSSTSRDSEWVRIEANEGAERNILAPALLENIKIPLRFRRIQAANLIGWSPETPDTPGVQALVNAIRRCLSSPSKNAA